MCLIGVDMHAQHGGHLFVDQFVWCPNAGAPDYVDAIKDIVSKYSVDMLIPMSEPELGSNLAIFRVSPRSKWITAGDWIVGAGLDKLETMRALSVLVYQCLGLSL